MRYFFASYAHPQGFGTISLTTEGEYPSYDSLIRTVRETDPKIKEVTILFIHEFSNKDDFDNFNGKDIS